MARTRLAPLALAALLIAALPAFPQVTVPWPPAATDLAWPGAEGFGRYSIGGRGSTEVCIIDRATDNDPDSKAGNGGEGDCPAGGPACDAVDDYVHGDFRFCVQDMAAQGDGRIIYSIASGVVPLCPGDPAGACDPIEASGDNVTLILSNAPGGGLTFTNGGGFSESDGATASAMLRLENVDHWTIIDWRCRYGEPDAGEYAAGDCLGLDASDGDQHGNLFVSWSEVSHALDENFSVTGPIRNATILQDSISAEPLQCSPAHLTNSGTGTDIANGDRWPHMTDDPDECPWYAGHPAGTTDPSRPWPRDVGWICEPGDPNEYEPCDRFGGGAPCVNALKCIRRTLQDHGRHLLVSNSGASDGPTRLTFGPGIWFHGGQERTPSLACCNGEEAAAHGYEIAHGLWYNVQRHGPSSKVDGLRWNVIEPTFVAGPQTRVGKASPWLGNASGMEWLRYGLFAITGYSEPYIEGGHAEPPIVGVVNPKRLVSSPIAGTCRVSSPNCPAGGCSCTLDDADTTCGASLSPPFSNCEFPCPEFSEIDGSYPLQGECFYRKPTPWPGSGLSTFDREARLEYLLTYGGVRWPQPDAFTLRYEQEVRDCLENRDCQSGALHPERGVALLAELGGVPAITPLVREKTIWDDDVDGICDAYEVAACGGDCDPIATTLAVADPNVADHFTNVEYFFIGWRGDPTQTPVVAPWIGEADCEAMSADLMMSPESQDAPLNDLQLVTSFVESCTGTIDIEYRCDAPIVDATYGAGNANGAADAEYLGVTSPHVADTGNGLDCDYPDPGIYEPQAVLRCNAPGSAASIEARNTLLVGNPSAGPTCTNGVDCFCDIYPEGGTTPQGGITRVCEDWEVERFQTNVGFGSGSPLFGPPYDHTGSVSGCGRGVNNYMNQTWGSPGAGQWGSLEPIAPILGVSCCAGATCFAKEWHPTDLWQGNQGSCMDVFTDGQSDLEANSGDQWTGGNSASGDVFDGSQSFAFRLFQQTCEIMGSKNIQSGSDEMGVIIASAYSTNIEPSLVYVTQWKHNEYGSLGSHWIRGLTAPHGSDSSKPYRPVWWHNPQSESVCNSSIINNASMPVGAGFSCSGSTVRYAAASSAGHPGGLRYVQTTNWPHGSWAASRAHIVGRNSTNTELRIWHKRCNVGDPVNGTLIIHLQGLNGQLLNDITSHVALDPYANMFFPPGPLNPGYTSDVVRRGNDNFHIVTGSEPLTFVQMGCL